MTNSSAMTPNAPLAGSANGASAHVLSPVKSRSPKTEPSPSARGGATYRQAGLATSVYLFSSGMVVTDGDDFFDRMSTLRDHGLANYKYFTTVKTAYKSKMGGRLVFGRAQLARVDELLHKKKENPTAHDVAVRSINLPSALMFKHRDIPKVCTHIRNLLLSHGALE